MADRILAAIAVPLSGVKEGAMSLKFLQTGSENKFLEYCSRYRVGTRGKGKVSTGTNHLGFRCVKSPGNARKGGVL